jgi:hypothetical protein
MSVSVEGAVMIDFTSRSALGFALLSSVAGVGCAAEQSEDARVLASRSTVGIAAIALEVAPDLTVDLVEATLSFPGGDTQQHAVNVRESGSTPTIFFRLPVDAGYRVQLSAKARQAGNPDPIDCTSESVSFDVELGAETAVDVPVDCTVRGSASEPTGSAVVTGIFSVTQAGCDPVLESVVVAPAVITDTNVPVTLEVFTAEGVDTNVNVSASLGTVSRISDTEWGFDCGSSSGAVTFTVNAACHEGCTETGTVPFECP